MTENDYKHPGTVPMESHPYHCKAALVYSESCSQASLNSDTPGISQQPWILVKNKEDNDCKDSGELDIAIQMLVIMVIISAI